jgi:hypothetical protein
MSLKIRLEEIPTVGEIVRNAYHEDQALFVQFSPSRYDGTFETNFETKLTAVKAIVDTHFHIGKIALLTKNIEEDIPKVLPYMDDLSLYVKFASADLTVPVKQFGIKEVRKAVNRGDAEELDGALHSIILNIEPNFAKLEDQGYKQEKLDELKALKLKIFTENTQQEEFMYDKQQAVVNNKALFDAALATIADIQATGKILFKRVNSAKVLEYTMQDILRKIRQETDPVKKEEEANAAACELDVICTDANGNPLEELTVTIVEYNLVVVTEEDGIAPFEAVPTTPAKFVTIRIEGETWKTQTLVNQELIPGEHKDIDVVMEPE